MTADKACAHFTGIQHNCCTADVNYLALAGGGAFSMVLRLRCIPITDRKGNDVQACGKFKELDEA